jgi:Domain of unknown function (DUF4260)
MDRLPHALLRLEGLALGTAATVVYFHQGYGWILFVALILAPDLSFVAYAFGPKVGAVVYDLLHTEVLPLALGTAGVVGGGKLATELALIWLAHIGVDRLVGYGLKYPTSFEETHFSRV